MTCHARYPTTVVKSVYYTPPVTEPRCVIGSDSELAHCAQVPLAIVGTADVSAPHPKCRFIHDWIVADHQWCHGWRWTSDPTCQHSGNCCWHQLGRTPDRLSAVDLIRELFCLVWFHALVWKGIILLITLCLDWIRKSRYRMYRRCFSIVWWFHGHSVCCTVWAVGSIYATCYFS